MEMAVSSGDEWQRFERSLASFYSPSCRAKATRKKVDYAIRLLKMFADSPAAVDEFTITQIHEYLNDRGCKKVTVSTVLGTVKAILNKAKKKRMLEENPFDVGDLIPRVTRRAMCRQHSHHSIDDVALVLMKADEDFEVARSPRRRFIAARTRAAAWLFAHVGARSMEIMRAKQERFDGEFLHICHEDAIDGHCKSEGSDRLVFIPSDARSRLIDLIALSGSSQWLFPTVNGDGPWATGGTKYCPLGRIKALAASVGVQGMTIHSLRHSFQTHARSRWGFGRDQVEFVVGHTDERTQDHYVHIDRDNLKHLMGRVSYF